MLTSLAALTAHLPLPAGWTEPEEYADIFRLQTIELYTVGLVTSGPGMPQLTASASGVDEAQTRARAYYELIERVSIWEAGASGVSSPGGVIPEPVSGLWKYSKSNGVAFHFDFNRASESAAFELVERDRILRSWYERSPSRRLSLAEVSVGRDLTDHYDLEVHQFSFDVAVVGVFGFPKKATCPLVFGFGAGYSVIEATQKAYRETLQRLSFLWGEELPATCPVPVPSPGYHQDYFLYPAHVPKIRDWLGRSTTEALPMTESVEEVLGRICFADVTPGYLQNKAFVVKAFSDRLVPLTFGAVHPYFEMSDSIHPVA